VSETPAIAEIDAAFNLAALREVQKHTSGLDRHRYGALIAAEITRRLGEQAPLSKDVAQTASMLNQDGVVRLGSVLTPEQVTAIVSHFKGRPCFNAHVPGFSDKQPRLMGLGAEMFHYGSYELADVMAAPLLLELANHPKILGVAQTYLGCLPTLYSLHAWWTFPGHGKAQLSQEFHRDRDDFKFCTLFVYLTDVDMSASPHVYLRRTHRTDLVKAAVERSGTRFDYRSLYLDNEEGYGRDELYERLFPGMAETITGSAGTAFVADTGGLHKGLPALERPRLMFWARYGIYRNFVALDRSPLPKEAVAGRLPQNWECAYINRCLVKS
jgi:hypothetical protein